MGDDRDRTGDEEGYGANPAAVPGNAPESPTRAPADAGEAWSFRNPDEQLNHDQDPEYGSWRDAQMAGFDRDYEEFRRQHPAGLQAEFAAWREAREKERR